MSKNTNLSFLTDFLTADIVNSRVGMNNVSPQSTFDVTGTGKFSGVLTLGSTISNGTYTYTLPSATGTLALTSDIPVVTGYVPYTGANQAVNLGYNQLLASTLTINGESLTGGSYLGFKHSTSVNTGSNGYTSIYTFGTNTIGFKSISGATTRDFSFSMASITPGVPGGRIYTLPDADGTIALTSQIPANPVGGTGAAGRVAYWNGSGTITSDSLFQWNDFSKRLGIGRTPTVSLDVEGAGFFSGALGVGGALNGTSASFTGSVTSDDLILTAGTLFGTGNTGFSNRASDTTLYLQMPATGFNITDNALNTRFILSSTGAATFSSSVTAGGNFGSNAANTSTAPQYFLTQTGGNTYSAIGINRADGTGIAAGIGSALVLRSGDATDFPIQFATANNVRLTITSGGNVLIGTPTDSGYKLDVNGSARINGLLTSGSSTSNGDFRIISNSNPFVIQGRDIYNRNFLALSWDIGPDIGTMFGNTLGFNVNSNPGVTAGTRALTLASTGAATFSSSVTAENGVYVRSGNGVYVNNASNTRTGFLITSSEGTELSSFAGAGEPLILKAPDASATIRFYTGGSTSTFERMRITSGGNVLIGTTTDTGAKLNVGGSYDGYPVSIEASSGGNQLSLTRGGAVAQFYMGGSTGAGTQFYVRAGGSGGVLLSAGSTGWVSASDIRLKDIKKPIEKAVESLSTLQTVYYSWKDSDNKNLHIGLIAQEVEKVFPELVSESSIDGMKGVNYTELIPVIIKAIQELNKKINA